MHWEPSPLNLPLDKPNRLSFFQVLHWEFFLQAQSLSSFFSKCAVEFKYHFKTIHSTHISVYGDKISSRFLLCFPFCTSHNRISPLVPGLLLSCLSALPSASSAGSALGAVPDPARHPGTVCVPCGVTSPLQRSTSDCSRSCLPRDPAQAPCCAVLIIYCLANLRGLTDSYGLFPRLRCWPAWGLKMISEGVY